MPEQLKVINVGDIKAGITNLSKTFIGIITGLALLMQLDVVKNFVTPILAGHPKTLNEVKEKRIPLQVRPFWVLESEGTLIS